jgi:SAM-dependent methyltransferase
LLDEWEGQIDFALVFWMLHEVPDSQRLVQEVYGALSEQGRLLYVEPIGHVSKGLFEKNLETMLDVGFKVVSSPTVAFSRSVVMEKPVS